MKCYWCSSKDHEGLQCPIKFSTREESKYDFVSSINSYSSEKEISDDKPCEPKKDDNENFFLESIELDDIQTSGSPIKIYCTELNIHNTCEGNMGSDEESCKKIERTETLSDK